MLLASAAVLAAFIPSQAMAQNNDVDGFAGDVNGDCVIGDVITAAPSSGRDGNSVSGSNHCIGTDSENNAISGNGHTLGSGNTDNIIGGENNSMGNSSNFNLVSGRNNDLGFGVDTSIVGGVNNTIGDNSDTNFLHGLDNDLGSSSNYNAISGRNNDTGTNADHNIVGGLNNALGDNNTNNIISGNSHVLGSSNDFNNVSGDDHTLGDTATHNIVSGDNHTLGLLNSGNSVSGRNNTIHDGNAFTYFVPGEFVCYDYALDGSCYDGTYIAGQVYDYQYSANGNQITGNNNTIGIASDAQGGEYNNAVSGQNNSIGDVSSNNMVSGSGNDLGNYSDANIISGSNNILGSRNNHNAVHGASNQLGAFSDFNLVSGKDHTLGDSATHNAVSGDDHSLGARNIGNSVSGINNTIHAGNSSAAGDFNSSGNQMSGTGNTIGTAAGYYTAGEYNNSVSGQSNSIGDLSSNNMVSGISNSLANYNISNAVSGRGNSLEIYSSFNEVSGYANSLNGFSYTNNVSGSQNSLGHSTISNTVSGQGNIVGNNINRSAVIGGYNDLCQDTGMACAVGFLDDMTVMGSNNQLHTFDTAGSHVKILGDSNTVNGAGSGWNVITGHNATVEGTGNFVAGGNFSSGATATGNDNIVVGAGASATTNQAVAIGVGANVAGGNSMAMGGQAASNGGNAVAIGFQSDAVMAQATALGVRAQATGSGATAIGAGRTVAHAAESSGEGAVAIGGATFAALIAGIITTNLQKVEADRQRAIAVVEAEKADERSEVTFAAVQMFSELTGQAIAAADEGDLNFPALINRIRDNAISELETEPAKALNTLHTLSQIHDRREDMTAVMETLRPIYEAKADRPDYPTALGLMRYGFYAGQNGDLETANSALNRSYAIMQRAPKRYAFDLINLQALRAQFSQDPKTVSEITAFLTRKVDSYLSDGALEGSHNDAVFLLSQIAFINFQKGQPDKALPLIERALEVNQSIEGVKATPDEQLLFPLIRIYSRMGRFEDAAKMSGDLIVAVEVTAGPSRRLAARYGQHAEIMQNLGKDAQAILALEKAYALYMKYEPAPSPGALKAGLLIATIQAKTGNADIATARQQAEKNNFSAAIREGGYFRFLYFDKSGDIFAALGDKEKARNAYGKALSEDGAENILAPEIDMTRSKLAELDE